MSNGVEQLSKKGAVLASLDRSGVETCAARRSLCLWQRQERQARIPRGFGVSARWRQRMCCTPSRNNKRHLPRRATRLSVSPRWPARANAGKTASALRIADLKSTDSTCSSSSATWNDVRFELKHRARMGAT